MKERLAIAIALAALVVAALGSTSLGQAATGAAKASVEKARSSKLAGPLRATASNPIRRGPRGKRGKRGLRGLRGLAGPPGAAGAQGVPGPAGPITGNLPGGVTLRGNYSVAQTGSTDFVTDSIMFNLRLSVPPVVHYINVGAPVPAECPGTLADPQAAAGHLCVFEGNATNTTNRGRVQCGESERADRAGLSRWSRDLHVSGH